MALFTTLSDNFDDNSLNTTLWTTYVDGNASVAETSGKVRITMPVSSTRNDYSGYTSVSSYDLTNNQVTVQLAEPNTGLNGEAYIVLFSGSTFIEISVTGNSTITYLVQTTGVNQTYSTSYDYSSQSWWRIRNTAGTILFDTSADGSSWINQNSQTISFSITSLQVEIGAGMYGINSSVATASFDNFNYGNNTRTAIGSASGGGTLILTSESANVTVMSSASGGSMLTYQSAFQPLPQKEYEYRVFDHSGNYIGVWDNIKSTFSYEQTINQNATELTVEIARSPDNRVTKLDMLLDTNGSIIKDENSDNILLQTETANAVGTGTDVEYNYNVDVYAFYGGYEALLDTNGDQILDENTDPILSQFGYPNGKRVYSGYIVDYELTYGATTGVRVTVVPHATEMSHYVYKSGTSTTIDYTTLTDPVVMAHNIMDSYISQGGRISYNAATMPLSGSTSKYPFKLQRIRDAIDKTVDLLPSGYYHFSDPGENLQYLLPQGSTANHTFYYEKHISDLKLKKTISQLVNDVYFTGGDMGAGISLYAHYEDTASKSSIRPGLEILSDSRVILESSANILSNREISEFKNPRYQTTVTITDAVYDIELIKPGHMIAFKNFGTFVDTLLLPVATVRKQEHSITLDLDTALPSDAKRLEDLKRAILSEQIRDIAATPV